VLAVWERLAIEGDIVGPDDISDAIVVDVLRRQSRGVDDGGVDLFEQPVFGGIVEKIDGDIDHIPCGRAVLNHGAEFGVIDRAVLDHRCSALGGKRIAVALL
jgi:hypothetical protein